MTKHTTEPWKVGFSKTAIIGQNYVLGSMGVYPNSEANTARIVACVNACEGIPTDILEMATDFADAGMKSMNSMQKEFDDLKAERDELQRKILDELQRKILAEVQTEAPNVYLQQDKDIRALINADPNESTLDEVERMKNRADKLMFALELLVESTGPEFSERFGFAEQRKHAVSIIQKFKDPFNANT